MRAARLAIAALAVAACAWFVIGVIQSHNESRATALINGGGTPTPTQTAQIGHWLDTAATLNPDRNIDLLRAQAEVRAGQSARALVLMKRVVARRAPQRRRLDRVRFRRPIAEPGPGPHGARGGSEARPAGTARAVRAA